MTAKAHRPNLSADEADIRALIDRWAEAVGSEDRAGIREDHDADILIFDVPPPLQSPGIDGYMATWETFFASSEKPVTFHVTDIEVAAGADIAFATAVGHCVNIDSSGRREPLTFRLTLGLRKMGGRWIVMHEHHSLPAA